MCILIIVFDLVLDLDMDSKQIKRGRGHCPKCSKEYFNRYKPKECSNCGELIGGSYTSEKKAKNTENGHSAVRVTSSVISVATTKRGNRCFVTRDEMGNWMCLNNKCKDKRAMHVSSGETKQFTCEHINEAVDNTKPPLQQIYISDEALTNYPCNSNVNEKLTNANQFVKDNEFAPVVKVSNAKYAVYADATASNPLDFCHIDVTNQSMSCTGKDCRGYMAKGKHKRVKCNCIHMHMYCLAKKSEELELALEQLPEDEQLPAEHHNVNDERADTTISTKASFARDNAIEIALARQLPYKFEKETIDTILEHDVNTWKDIPHGWPEVFVPSYSNCQKCGFPLSPPKYHSGKRGNSYLITELNPFKIIDIKVKTCSNLTCQTMHQAVPFEIGE